VVGFGRGGHLRVAIWICMGVSRLILDLELLLGE
jgi:hypothetical protein